jgi:uncharacterized Zn-binding protein involved in type VI secretion
MTAFSRVGDLCQTGGIIIDGASTVTAGGLPLALVGSRISPHDCCSQSGNSPTVGTPCSLHCSSIIITGYSNITCEGGIQVAHITSQTSCSHPIVTGLGEVTGGS